MNKCQLRLKNCIETILGLEPRIKAGGNVTFNDNFSTLRFYLGRLEQMELAEEDVLRLERVTSDFLDEAGHFPCWRRRGRKALT